MSSEVILSVLAKIGIDESPTGLEKSMPVNSNLKAEELIKLKNYWKGPETVQLRKYWYESNFNSEMTIPEYFKLPVAELDYESDRDYWVHKNELMSTNQMQSIFENELHEDSPEKLSNDLVWCSRRKKNESTSSGLESDVSSLSSSCSSLLDIIDLDIGLPKFPIKPLSLMAEIKYPERQTKRVNEKAAKLESLVQQKHCQNSKLHEGNELKIKYHGRNILNMERHLSTYISPWDTITESNIMRNPNSRNYTYGDLWNSCQYECDDQLGNTRELMDNDNLYLDHAIERLHETITENF